MYGGVGDSEDIFVAQQGDRVRSKLPSNSVGTTDDDIHEDANEFSREVQGTERLHVPGKSRVYSSVTSAVPTSYSKPARAALKADLNGTSTPSNIL